MTKIDNITGAVMDSINEAEEALRRAYQSLAQLDGFDPTENDIAVRMRRIREDVGALYERIEDIGLSE